MRRPPPGCEAGPVGYCSVGCSVHKAAGGRLCYPLRGPELRRGAARAVEMRRLRAKALLARADGNDARRGSRGGAVVTGARVCPLLEGPGAVPPGGSLGPCCPLQGGGGTARKGPHGLGAGLGADRVLRRPHLVLGARRTPTSFKNNKRVTLVNVKVKGCLEEQKKKVGVERPQAAAHPLSGSEC